MNFDPSSSKMLSVYDRRKCLGFILARCREGFEAFSSDKRSRGLFVTQQEALAALSRNETTAQGGVA